MNVTIRQETRKDYKLSEVIIEKSFKNVEYSNHKEQFLVKNLRKEDTFIPELSLVAEFNEKIVGYIMFTKIIIKNKEIECESLALAPVSVLPSYQNKNIGSKLINKGLNIAKEMGFKSVIVLGNADYYSRFGFKLASLWEIKAPFEVADELFMALELQEKSLSGISGNVIYSDKFFE